MSIIYSALEQSLLFFPLALGIYLSYAILNTTDMTTEGSFVLGAGSFARMMSLDFSVGIGIVISLMSGAVAGIGVSLIQAKNKINSLIAGIIGLFMLYTLNFKIMGRPNIGLNEASFYGVSKSMMVSIVLCVTILLGFLLISRMGLILRAYGNNCELLKSLGKNIELIRTVGLILSNVLASLCGVLTAVTTGFADLNMGFGMTLTGLSTVMMGQQIQKRFFPSAAFSIYREILACFLGVYLYFFAINGLLFLGLDPIYLKLVLGITLIVLLRERLTK